MKSASPNRFILAAVIAIVAGAAWAASPPAIRESADTFTSENKTIKVERFEPKADGKFPTVIVLHGADGLNFGGGRMYQEFSRTLARNGYVAVFPHYFEKTDTKWGDAVSNFTQFAPWTKTVQETITWAAKLPNVDAQRIGVAGFSLGGYLSVGVGAQDKRVKAVVEFWGGAPFAAGVENMPPVLIMHGEADSIVNVSEARRLEQLLKDKKKSYEIKIYPGQNHVFLGDAATDSMERALRFLEKNLKK